jgi:hypothetical protein
VTETTSPGEGAPPPYGASDVKVLFRRGDWQAWHEAVNWLQRSGEEDRALTPGAPRRMIEDIEQLVRAQVPIARNWLDAYRLLRAIRGERPA